LVVDIAALREVTHLLHTSTVQEDNNE